jgi:heterodisulfide reductase subunit C
MALVTIGCIAFLIRRASDSVPRISNGSLDLKGWASKDANIILYAEIILMAALMFMNAADQILQSRNVEHYIHVGSFPVSSLFVPLLSGLSDGVLIGIERGFWWIHIIGIMAFLNYIPHSKHFHIMLAFPNVYFSKLTPKGQLNNDDFIKREVQSMFDPTAEGNDPNAEMKLGAKDVFDLTWKQLLESYTCTECGRCTSVCPANITGKKLSPRKIMMSTRDRLEEVGKNIDRNKGSFVDDGKTLLNDYITPEELWACTTCNACVEACPVNIDPVSIIVDLRRYLVMDQSAAPESLNHMFVKVENNGNPWGNAPTDRFEWANNIEIPN